MPKNRLIPLPSSLSIQYQILNHLSTEFSPRPELDYPFEKGWHPTPGEPFEVVEGVFWVRVPLPIALDHINLWLLRDGDEWVIVDSGFDALVCQQVWDTVFATFISAQSVNRIIITHYHPDHIGLAAWLAHRCDCPILITRGELERYRGMVDRDEQGYSELARSFIGEFGFSQKFVDLYQQFFSVENKDDETRVQVDQCQIIADGDHITIDGQEWKVVMGNGHSPEHACLYNAAKNVLISGDQVISRISSNISVYVANRGGNPLRDWLNSCEKLKTLIPEDALILAAHQEPFVGVVPRLQQLIDDHHAQLNKLRLSSTQSSTVREMTDVLFDRKLSDPEVLMAASETLAHINYLLHRNELTKTIRPDGTAEYLKS